MFLFIRKTLPLLFAGFILCENAVAQSYTSFFTGDTADATINPAFGICLMGGATEDDNAMKWFLQKANGGDVVVIRASGGNGYNDYLFSQLGITVNSVETLVLPDSAAARHPYVRRRLAEAEAVFIAGGDQYNYHRFWKNSAVDSAINHLVNVRGGVIGGTSAGMAVMGAAYFSAANGTVTSGQALSDPFDTKVALVTEPLFSLPMLESYITDTHFDNPDRRGRISVFLARLSAQFNRPFFSIACDEYTAVCIDETGLARVFGGAPQYPDDFAYFIHTGCQEPFHPEILSPQTPLTWNRNQQALRVYRIAGNAQGTGTRSLTNLNQYSGGQWFNWYIDGGTLNSSPAVSEPDFCLNSSIEKTETENRQVFPNPAENLIRMSGIKGECRYTIFHLSGKIVKQGMIENDSPISVQELPSGPYLIEVEFKGNFSQRKLFLKM